MHLERKLGPLFRLALKSGAVEAIALHVQRGEALNGRDSSGLTPLMIAAIQNQQDACKKLLALGANSSLLSSCGRTASELAFDRGHLTLAELLSSLSFPNMGSLATVEIANVAPDAAVLNFTLTTARAQSTAKDNSGTAHQGSLLLFDDIIEPPEDLNGWAAADMPEAPAHDVDCVTAARNVQRRISEHRRIADETDWSEIEFDLPEARLIQGPISRDDLVAVDCLIACGLRDGYVAAHDLRSALEADGTPDLERAEEVVVRLLDDLGILVETTALPLHRIDAEDGDLDEIFAELRYNLAHPPEPTQAYLSEARKYDLIKREDEERLGRQMDSALGALTRLMASLPDVDWPLFFPENLAFVEIGTGVAEDGDEVDETVVTIDSVEEGEPIDGTEGTLEDFCSYVRHVRDGGLEKGRDSAVPRPTASDIVRILNSARQMNCPMARDVMTSIATYEHARDRLVTANLRLAISLAHKFRYSSLPLEDLIQEANLGLMRAAERYDFRRGFKFSTYATWWIRQAISRGIQDTSRTIRIPVHQGEKINLINRVRRELDYGRASEVSVEEIAIQTSLSPKQILQIMRLDIRVISINECGPGLEPHTPDPVSIIDPVYDSSKTACDRSLTKAIERMFIDLDKRGRQVIMARFGFDGAGGKTLEEVGNQLGVTRERIRQIESKTLRKFHLQARIDVLAPYATSARPVPEVQEKE
jgi:RNA polymerase primary sigma factor